MDLKTVTRRLSTKLCKTYKKMESFVEQLFCIKYNTKFIKNICETFSLRIYVWSTSLWNRLVNHSPTCVDNNQAKKYIFLNCCVAAGLLHGTLEQLKTGRPLFIDQTASIQSTIQQFNAILRTFSFQSKLP